MKPLSFTRPCTKNQFESAFTVEALEPRILLSGDGVALLNPGASVIVEMLSQTSSGEDDLDSLGGDSSLALFETTYASENEGMTPFAEPAASSADELSLNATRQVHLGTLMPSANLDETPLLPDLVLSGQDVSSITVTIANGQNQDRLRIQGDLTGTEGDITWDFDTAAGTLTLMGDASAAEFEALLRTLSYTHNNPAAATFGVRTISVEVTFEDGSSESDGLELYLAHMDAGIQDVFTNLNATFESLLNALMPAGQPSMGLLLSGLSFAENTDLIPLVFSTIRDLVFPQRFVPVDGNGNIVAQEDAVDFVAINNFEATLQPWDVFSFFDFGTALTSSYSNLDQLAQALSTRLTHIAQTILGASAWEVHVDFEALEDTVGFRMNVGASATRAVSLFPLELSFLREDLGFRLVGQPVFGGGGGVELAFTLDVDLSNHDFDGSSISDAATTLTFENVRGTAGLQFSDQTFGVEIGMLRGQAVNASGRVFASLPLLFPSGNSRSIGSWSSSHFGVFTAGGGEAILDLPIQASLFGQTVTQPDTKIQVFVADIFEGSSPEYTAVDYAEVQAFALMSPEEVIQGILNAGSLFGLLENSGEDLLGIPLPFLNEVFVRNLFNWFELFTDEIGNNVDLRDILLRTPGNDAMTDIRLEDNFEPMWFLPNNTTALLQQQMRFAFVVNQDLSTYQEIVIPSNGLRITLDDLVMQLNGILNGIGGFFGPANGGLRAENRSESLAFFAPATSGIRELHLLPHPNAPADLTKFALIQGDLVLLEQESANGWVSSFALDPGNPLIGNAAIAMTLDGVTRTIQLNRIAGESADAMLGRLAGAIDAAFGPGEIGLFIVNRNASGELVLMDEPDAPFYLLFRPLEENTSLELATVSDALAHGVIPLGFTVGDRASTPRPDNLRTFEDFVNPSIVGRVPNQVSYDPVSNTVSFGYFQPLQPGQTLERNLDINLSFPSVGQVTPAMEVTVSISSEFGFGFVIDFVLSPSEPLIFFSETFSELFDDVNGSFVLSDDARFSLNFVLGNDYDVVVSVSDTVGNTHLQDLVGDLNRGLSQAVNANTGAVADLTADTMAAFINFGSIQLSNAVRLSTLADPFILPNTNGQLSSDTILSFDLHGQTHLLALSADATSDFTHFGDLIGYINEELANTFIDLDNDGMISQGDELVSLFGLVFASTLGNTDEAFHLFSTFPSQPNWTFSANLTAEANDVFQTEMRFTSGNSDEDLRLNASVSGRETRLRGFDGTDLNSTAPIVFGGLSYTLPTNVDGTFQLGFNEVSFGALDASGPFILDLDVFTNSIIPANDLLLDPVNGLDVTFSNYPSDFSVSLMDLSSPVSPIDAAAEVRFTVADFQAVRVDRFVDFSLPIPLFQAQLVNGEATGLLLEDTEVAFFHDGREFRIAVAAADTLGNDSFDDLVAQFNAALTAAQLDDITVTTFDISDEFQFRADAGFLQLQVLSSVPNPDYVVLDILPGLSAFGAVGAQSGFSTQSVADGLFLVLEAFNEIVANADGFFAAPLPIINTAINQMWSVTGDFGTRILSLLDNPANSASVLPLRIAEAFGLSASDVDLSWDDDNQAFRIDFAFLTGAVFNRPVDINPADFARFVEGSHDGVDRLIDGANRSPATFRGIATFNVALGIDLTDPVNPRFFLYEHDGSEDFDPENGTSISVDFQIFAEGIDFTSSRRALGLFIRDGMAILAGPVSEENGQTAFMQDQNRNGTPFLLHMMDTDFANLTIAFGNSSVVSSSGKLYLDQAANGGETNFGLSSLEETVTGSVQVILPIYTPTELINPFENRIVSDILLVDPVANTAEMDASAPVGGNVFELRIYDLGQFAEDRAAWSTLTGPERGAVQASGNVELFVPDPEAVPDLEMPTLLDLLRDPALILDGIDFFFGVIQGGLAVVGSLPIPIVGPAFQGAANTIFRFRDTWLLDMRNRLRGAGEGFGQLVRESIFQTLGPEGEGILLEINGISGLDGQVQASNPDDIIFNWVDDNGDLLTDVGARGANGFEFRMRLGSVLLEAGFSTDLNFDTLHPVFSIGMDGGFGFAVGWDLQIGFGFNLDDGFYIIVDADRNELEVRVEGTLRGAQDHFEVRQIGSAGLPPFPGADGTGYGIWNRRDEEWVRGPARGDGSRLPLHVINVDADGNIVDLSQWEDNLVFGSNLPGGTGCDCNQTTIGIDTPETFWVVAAQSETSGAYVPAFLDNLGQFRPQTGSSFDPTQMILFDRAQPFTAFGTLFFQTLKATDQIQIGLDAPGDADYAFGIDESQRTPNERNDSDNGVRRNNHLPSRARASIGVNLWDPSSQAEKNTIEALAGSKTGFIGKDWTGAVITDIGLGFASEIEEGHPVVSFNNLFDTDNGDLWFIVNLIDEENADDIRDHFNDLIEENGWFLEVQRFASYTSSVVIVERVTLQDGVWSFVDGNGDLQPVFEQDWVFIVPRDGENNSDFIRVKHITLGDDFYDITNHGTGWYIVDHNFSPGPYSNTRGLEVPVFLFDEMEEDWGTPLFMLLSSTASLEDAIAGGGALNTDFFTGQGGEVLGPSSNTDNLVRWGYWLPVQKIDFDPSENRITWKELRGDDSGKIFQLLLRTDIVINLTLDLSLADSTAFPRMIADLNLDWGVEINFLDDNPTEGKNWTPHLGVNNIRLDMGSFLSQYLKPVFEQLEKGLGPIRPVVDALRKEIPVISTLAGRPVSLVTLLAQFGGPKGKSIATFIDIVGLVSDLSQVINSLPSDMNAYLPIGNFWLVPGQNGLAAQIFYDNNEIISPSFAQQNQAITGDNISQAAMAFGRLNDARTENQPNQGITNRNQRGGFGFPIFSDPKQVFNLIMGGDAVLMTFSLPQLDFSLVFQKSIGTLGPVSVGLTMGIRFSLEIQARLHFGFDTYGIRKAAETGNPFWAVDGFYISDRANADGTGPDVPEMTLRVSIELFGAVDIFLARGELSGKFTLGVDIDLGDPNRDGKVRPSELLAVLEWTNNPLRWFNIRIFGTVEARYSWAVMIPVPFLFGIRRVTVLSGGSTFLSVTLFEIEWKASDGPPILAEKVNFTTPTGEVVNNALLLNMGPNSENRITSDDPFYNAGQARILDGSERFVVTGSGSTVTVTLFNRAGTAPVHSTTFHGVSMVVAYAGEGNDIIDASGLNGIPVYFEGLQGNNTITVGSTHLTRPSWVIGGSGNDVLTVINGGYTYFDGVSGTNAITLGQGSTTVNVVEAGRDRDTVSGGGNNATNTVNFSSGFGDINLSGISLSNAYTTLDFSRTFFPLDGEMSEAGSFITAGGRSRVMFHLAAITQIKGSQNRDDFVFRRPHTHRNGLMLRGGLGNDVFTFVLGDYDNVAAAGITIDNNVMPTSMAVLGTPVLDDCGGIREIPLLLPGSGFIASPEVQIVDATGFGARAIAGLNSDGTLNSIFVTRSGTGYTNPIVTLVTRTSFNDTVRFILEDTAAFTQDMTVVRANNQQVLTYEGKQIRMADSVENIIIEAPGAVVAAGQGGITLDGRFQLRAEQFIHTGSVTADSIMIITDQGFAVDHPLAAINHGSITLQVLGRGESARAIPVIVGSGVVGYTMTDSGSFYNFVPQVVVRGGSAGTGIGAFGLGIVDSNREISGINVVSTGFGYSLIPHPDAYITSPSSILLNASLSSTAFGSPAGFGDGRGTITLKTPQGSVITTADVIFPTGSQVAWENGDFRFLGDLTLDDIQSGGSGAIVESVIDSDGRVVDFIIHNGGSGYSFDFAPTVNIQGVAEATAIIENGQVVGFNLINPGNGYAIPPLVSIDANGLSKIFDGSHTRHIKAASGFLVMDTHSGVGTIHRPVQTDVRVFVGRARLEGDSNIYILENNGFDIGLVDGINGVSTNRSDIHLVSFSGDINLGMPVQRTNAAGDLLWQNPEKTIPIYETFQERTIIGGREFLPGDLVYVGGNLNARSGNIIMVADNFNVNAVVSSTAATLLSLRPSNPTAPLGLAGSRALAEAVLDEYGTVIGLNLLWQGRGYTDEPLVIFNAPGDRAFAVASSNNGSVTNIEITFGGSFYLDDAPPEVTLSAPNLIGGTQATAQAIVLDGEVVGIEITNPGTGYTSAPRVNIALPGQQATARAIVENGRIVGFFDLQGGSNYSFVPRVTISQPFKFGLDQFEIDFFQAGFDNFEVGRRDGRNRVVTATQTFQETTILRGDSHFFEDTFVDGDLIVFGSGNTSFFDTGLTEADSITFNDALIINAGQTHTFRATAGGILFQLPGTLNGTLPNFPLNPANQENVILDATGNIQIVGAIGNNAQIHNLTILQGANITFNDTISISGDLIIERGAQITFERDVRIDGNLIIGNASDLSRIGSVTFTPGARLDVQGNIEIYSQGAVNFRNDVGQIFAPENVTVVSGDLINFEGRFDADQVQLTAGDNHDIYFNQQVRVQDMHTRAGNLTRVDSTISVGTGNLTLTTNRVELLGGAGSIRNQTGTTGVSTLTIEPFTTSRNMAVGAPVFFFGEEGNRLNITFREIAAINTGFFEVIFGDVVDGTGDVFVSDLGSTPNNFVTSPPAIQNPTTIVGGFVQVGYANDPTFFDPEISDVFEFIQPSFITVSSAAEYLRFKSLVSDVRIDASINTFIQRNGWIRMEAERDIIINRPVQALRRISLTSGYSGAIAGSVVVNSTGENTGHLITTQTTTINHVIEISAGRTGGVTGGNIVFTDVEFTDAGGDITVWARNEGGRILMQAPGGTITQNDGLLRAEILSLTSYGDISLDLTDVVRIGEGTIDGATLWKDGFVKDSGDAVFIDGIVITGPGSLTMLETDDLIIDNIETASDPDGGNITISNLVGSEGDFRLGTLNATDGAITLTADGAITDNLAGQNIVNLTTTGLVTLEAKTGIGGPGDEDIDTDIGSLQAKTTVSGGIHIDERNGLVIAGPVTTAGDGPILLSLQEGDLEVNHAMTADGSGNILLETLDGSVTLDAAVSSGTGHITVLAEEMIELLANGSLSTGTPGTVYIKSETGELIMDEDSTVSAADSSIFITTLGAVEGDIYLSSVTGQRVSVVSANFSIFSANTAMDNVTSTDLRLEASRAIGTNAEALNISTVNLAASAIGTAPGPMGIFLSQKGNVTVGEIAPVVAQIVDTDNELTAGGDTSALADLRTGNTGPIVLVAEGSVTLNDGNENGAAVAAHTTGNVLIRAIGEEADLTINGNVLTGTGHLSLMAERSIFQNANVTTGTPGTVFLQAENGEFVMDQDAVIEASDSSILIRVEQDATLGLLKAPHVSVKSFEGSIFSTEDTTLNVLAINLRLEAGNAIGQASAPLLLDISNLTAHAESQSGTDKGIYLQNEGSVTVTAVEVSVDRVLADANTTTEIEFSQYDLATENDGDIVLTTVDGTITLTDANGNGFAISAAGSGEVILTANGTDRDILAETGADIRAGTGDITLTAQRNIRLNAANVVFVTSGEGEITLTATTGEIFMTDGSTIQSEDGDIYLEARLDISLSLIESETGDIVLYSREAAIIDNTVLEEPNLVTDGHLAMKAATGIGDTGVADINTEVGTLTAINTGSGLIVITEETDLIIDVFTDEPFAPDYDTYGILNEATGGSILIRTLDGSMTVDAPIEAAAGGHILLQVNSDENDLEVNDTITAREGSITLENTGDGNVLVQAMVTSDDNGTIYILAEAGSILFNENGGATTDNENIALIAQVDVAVTGVNAGSGNVTIHATTGEIRDGGDQVRDVTANDLKLRGAGSIGAGDALDTDISRLAAHSTNGQINVTNLGSLLIEEIPVISYNKVLLNNTLQVVNDGDSLNNVVADSDITLVSETGSLTLRDPFSTDDAIRSSSGDISLTAEIDVLQNASIYTAAGEKIDVTAVTGNIIMAYDADNDVGTLTYGPLAEITYTAAGDILLSTLRSDFENITVDAGDRIVDNRSGDEDPNIITEGRATLLAVNGIGGLGLADINLNVGSVTATNTESGRIVIREVNGLEIDPAGLMNTGTDGDIILTVDLGDLTVNGEVESAEGNILLDVLQGALTVNKEIDAESGVITLTAQTDVNLSARVTASADVSVEAVTGTLVFAADSVVSTADANARLRAGNNLILAQVNAVDVSLIAGNNLTRAVDSPTNVLAENLRIQVGGSVATSADKLLTDVNTLAALADTGDIFIENLSDLTVGEVAVTVDEVTASAGLSTLTDAAQNHVTATAGDVVLVNDGDLSLGLVQGNTVTLLVTGSIVHLPGSGTNVIADSLRIVTDGDIGTEAGPLVIDAGTLAATAENMYIDAIGDLLLGAVTDTEGSDNGLTAADDIILSATGDLSMGPVTGGTVKLSSGGDMINVTGTLLNIFAADLTLTAVGNIGSLTDPLRIGAGTVRGESVTGSIHLDARDSLRVDSLSAAEDIILNVDDLLEAVPGSTTNLTANRARLTAGSDIGPLMTNLNILAAFSDTGGLELTNASNLTLGTVESLHGVEAHTGIILTTLSGRILDGGDLNDDVVSRGPVVLSAAQGIGLASNALEISAPNLTLLTTGAGSVYVNLTGETVLDKATLGGSGHFYLNADADLILAGYVTTLGGSVFMTVDGAVTGQADMTAQRQLRVTARSIHLEGTAVWSAQTDRMQLRVQEDIVMAVGAHLSADTRNLSLTADGDIHLATVFAGRTADIRAGGDVIGIDTEDRSVHEIEALSLRMDVDGTIRPVLTRVSRLDVRSGEVEEIREYDSVTAGYFGFALVDPEPKQEFLLRIDEGGLTSLRDTLRLEGDTVLVLLSDGTLTLGTAIESPDGDIRIEVDRLEVSDDDARVISAPNGNLELISGGGVGTLEDPIVVDAGSLTLNVEDGDVFMRFPNPVVIGPEDWVIESGGEVNLHFEQGDLVLEGGILHQGDGDIVLRVDQGGIVSNHPDPNRIMIRTEGSLRMYLDTGVHGGRDPLRVVAGFVGIINRTGTLNLRFEEIDVRVLAMGITIQEGFADMLLTVRQNLIMEPGSFIHNFASGKFDIFMINGNVIDGQNTRFNQDGNIRILRLNEG
jgi:uncharacterized protein (DUF2345 family)